jgi:Lon protease-like protein
VTEKLERLPIFPLPTVVLFPGLRVPLHVFEPRYRQMTAAALEADRRIAMVTILPDEVNEAAGDPALYGIGCAGSITDVREHPDGRYDILLAGEERVRLVSEEDRPAERLFRTAKIVRLADEQDPQDSNRIAVCRTRITHLVAALLNNSHENKRPRVSAETFESFDNTTFVNALATALPFAPIEKQGLLEEDSIADRYEKLAALIEFLRSARTATLSGSDTLH